MSTLFNDEFSLHLINILGNETAIPLLKSFNEPAIRAFRFNQLKINKEQIIANFKDITPHPYIPYAFYDNKRQYDLGKSPLHFGGAIYIQDSSAMMVSQILNPKAGDRVIDLCAAPGGKATQALTLMNDTGLLVANDISYKRAKIINENLERLGLKNAIVTNNSVDQLVSHFQGYFDKVILDAPCSGEGMFRKNNLVRQDWSINKVHTCAEIQKHLIVEGYKLLKKGGIMVYSTCTFEIQENEEVIEHLLANTNAKLINIEKQKGFTEGINLLEAIRIYPSNFAGEGHFICLIECNDDHFSNLKPVNLKINREDENYLKHFLTNYCQLSILHSPLKYNNLINYLPYGNIDVGNLTILRYGVPLGTIEKNRFEPSISLGYAYPFTIDYQIKNQEEYQKYLHGDIIGLDTNLTGYLTVSYLGIRIGIGKANGKHIKNLLPKGLRI